MDGPKKYLRCPCGHCGKDVEFPDYAAGGMTICPHCGKSTRTVAPAPSANPSPIQPKAAPVTRANTAPSPSAQPRPVPAPPRPKSRASGVLLIGASFVVLALGSYAYWRVGYSTAGQKLRAESSPVAANSSSNPPATVINENTSVVSVSNTPPPPVSVTTSTSMVPTNDFKIGDLTFQRPKGTKGSKVTYVVGTLENTSAQPRFGIRLELDLLDRTGAKIDSARDYCETIAARQTWSFRAMVLDSNAVTAKLAAIKEDR